MGVFLLKWWTTSHIYHEYRIISPIPHFSPFLPNLGELEKVGPEGYENMRSFVFFSLQSTKQQKYYPFPPFLFPSLVFLPFQAQREREREKKKCLELDNQIKYKGLSQKKKKNQVKRLFFCIFYFLKKFYTIIILV